MKSLLLLLKGEFIRLIKYKIAIVGLFVTIIWIGAIATVSKEEAQSIVPMLIFADAAIMSVLLLCASMYFEKQEGTLRTTLIAPVKIWQITLAKIIASITNALVSACFVALGTYLIHGIAINVLLLLFSVIVVVGLNALIAIIISMFSRDFGSMIVNYFIFTLVLIMPTLLVQMGVFGTVSNLVQWLMLLSPLQAGSMLINSAFMSVDIPMIIVALLYSMTAFGLLYKYVVLKKFKIYAMGD